MCGECDCVEGESVSVSVGRSPSLPWDNALSARVLPCQPLEADESLCLQLVEGLAGRQANVVHALGVSHAQSRALPTCQQQHCHLSAANQLQPCSRRGGQTVREPWSHTLRDSTAVVDGCLLVRPQPKVVIFLLGDV